MADHPLRPATRLRLGRPLPYQLADGTRTPPSTTPFKGHLSRRAPQSSPTYAVLAILSDCCPPSKGRLSTCYSPVRRCTRGPKPSFSLDLHVLGLPLTFALSQDQTLHLKSGRFLFLALICTPDRTRVRPGVPPDPKVEGIKPMTSLAIQFSKTDAAKPREGYRPREPVSTMSGGKGKSFFSFFSASSRSIYDVSSTCCGPGKI